MHLKCISIFNRRQFRTKEKEEDLSRRNNIGQNTTDVPQHGTENSGVAPQNQTLAPQLYSELVEAMRNLRQVQETQGKMLESLIKEESATKFTIFASLFDWRLVKSKIDCLCDCDSPQGEIGDDKVKNFQDLLSP